MQPRSQPSPFSPEVQSFILTKFDPLLTIVKELNDRLHIAEKERYQLEKRVSYLEDKVRLLQQDESLSLKPRSQEVKLEDRYTSLPEDKLLNAPWIFSCQLGTPTASLQVLLEFTPDSTEELDVRQWNAEEDMWISFLENLPPSFAMSNYYGTDLKNLRATARTVLIDLCKGELLLILRQVPGKQEAMQSKRSITFVAIMAAALSEAWTRIERTESSLLGRIALIFEGECIGRRFRAGHHKFIVEPLN